MNEKEYKELLASTDLNRLAATVGRLAQFQKSEALQDALLRRFVEVFDERLTEVEKFTGIKKPDDTCNKKWPSLGE